MITQIASDYGSISSDIQNIVANKCSILDRYILMQTGEYEYTALVYNPCTKKCSQYTFTRIYGNNSRYEVSKSQGTFEYQVNNEYYVYSNDGYGRSLNLPVTNSVIAFSLLIISCTLMFAIVFKGVLFKCLRRKR